MAVAVLPRNSSAEWMFLSFLLLLSLFYVCVLRASVSVLLSLTVVDGCDRMWGAQRSDQQFVMHVSYIEIYNDSGYDLLDPIRDTKKPNADITDLPYVIVWSDEARCARESLTMVMGCWIAIAAYAYERMQTAWFTCLVWVFIASPTKVRNHFSLSVNNGWTASDSTRMNVWADR